MKNSQSKLKSKNSQLLERDSLPLLPKSPSPLKIGFVVSLVLHSALLATIAIKWEDSHIKSAKSSAISLSLANIQSDDKSTKQTQNIEKKKPKKPQTKENPATKPQDLQEPQKAQEAESSQNQEPQSATSSPNESENIEILGSEDSLYLTIKDIIDKHRSTRPYPRMARKKNIKGDVVVEFVIYTNGDVGKIKVVDGTHKILDSDAIDTIKTAKYPKFDKNIKIKIALAYDLS